MTVEPVTGKQSNGGCETPQPGFKHRLWTHYLDCLGEAT